ncbi:uncharacterized protein C8R40DRAFT_334836 [Lentinula edodes]|uniref:uncharacterized protein n=1 Tax=Lentinula edodes TaxID=5353 RepID=UPI001E8DD946|nr:uncharacterized protein C8R40DRAFT_334836 [Lentinula edodes]KAH7874273.1 hypothetical protein C8R40DRAFT_334836 [Lentinula edodes]
MVHSRAVITTLLAVGTASVLAAPVPESFANVLAARGPEDQPPPGAFGQQPPQGLQAASVAKNLKVVLLALSVKVPSHLLGLLDSMVLPTSVDSSEFRTVDLKACEVLDLIRLLETCFRQVHPEVRKVLRPRTTLSLVMTCRILLHKALREDLANFSHLILLTLGVGRCLDSRALRALPRRVSTLKIQLVDPKACNKARLPQTGPDRVGLSLLTNPLDVGNHLKDHLKII